MKAIFLLNFNFFINTQQVICCSSSKDDPNQDRRIPKLLENSPNVRDTNTLSSTESTEQKNVGDETPEEAPALSPVLSSSLNENSEAAAGCWEDGPVFLQQEETSSPAAAWTWQFTSAKSTVPDVISWPAYRRVSH